MPIKIYRFTNNSVYVPQFTNSLAYDIESLKNYFDYSKYGKYLEGKSLHEIHFYLYDLASEVQESEGLNKLADDFRFMDWGPTTDDAFVRLIPSENMSLYLTCSLCGESSDEEAISREVLTAEMTSCELTQLFEKVIDELAKLHKV